MKARRELTSDAHLSIALLNHSKVIVHFKDNDEIADYGGPIELINDDAVKINGMYYTKRACRFYLR
ncbi:hypothetical protein ACFFSY_29570 [Paenibacillus aurantiacus]|uniref:Uncharacterized protein n=1 Tax=Paenibacillus aurantiacus TaxID=1936118 RepID=A0ABV5KY06_9BACL